MRRSGLLVPLLVVGALLGVFAAAGTVFVLVTRDDEHPEVRWLRSYAEWAQRVDQGIVDGNDFTLRRCARRFRAVHEPPSERVANVLDRLLETCRALAADPESAAAASRWWYWSEQLTNGLIWGRPLPTEVTFGDESRIDPKVNRLAQDLVQLDLEARCWSQDDWDVLQEEWRILAREPDWWLAGVAEPGLSRVHLAAHVCAQLARFLHQNYQPVHNENSVQLAESLVVLAHEARHIAHPEALEATVECYALQDVRQAVRRAGRPASYANELALLAWEIGYPGNFESYKSRECRNGGKLDRRPKSDVWP